ncbi:hypothetical protein H8N00_04060 [Streptomyces sp. AC563]|uniref:helix-turn-helix domain-containing protein n=1 Tax=Streptomyces buecherae TaxID=2763006 RepID=UPI00164CF648|nr:helix-turn-helix transcriptional regulator [Streptomyces buecherae]MBC3988088.1 hypothetical protein [Streptomyces buecherae]
MSEVKHACAFCRRGMDVRQGPGRRRVYCSTACRRRAQRARSQGQRERPSQPVSTGLALSVAEGLPEEVAALLAAEQAGAALEAVLERARRLAREVECYVAAAVEDGRRAGRSWDEVAAAAAVSTYTARTRWGEGEVRRLLGRRDRERGAGRDEVPRVSPGRASAARQGEHVAMERAGRALAAALSQLHGDRSLQELARAVGRSPSYISRILSGERSAAWPVVEALVRECGGRPEYVRHLWESAHGLAPRTRVGVDEAARRVHAAVMGLYLAAACPDVEQVCKASEALSAEWVKRVLAGVEVPDWARLSALVSALGARPGDLRAVWEGLHYTLLATLDAPLETLADGGPAPRGAAGRDEGE